MKISAQTSLSLATDSSSSKPEVRYNLSRGSCVIYDVSVQWNMSDTSLVGNDHAHLFKMSKPP